MRRVERLGVLLAIALASEMDGREDRFTTAHIILAYVAGHGRGFYEGMAVAAVVFTLVCVW